MEASPKPNLHLVNPVTGEVGCRECEAKDLALEVLEGKQRNWASELGRVKKMLVAQRLAEAEAADIVEVLTYWCARCTKRPAQVAVDRTTHPRWEKVRDRLQDNPPFSVAELKAAVDGALVSPFHNGTDPKNDVTKGGKQYLSAETIFKNAKTVEDHLARSERYVELVGVWPSEVHRALVGMDMKSELQVCDCGHFRLFHVACQETQGREVCRKCDCGGFSVFDERVARWMEGQT